MFIIIINKIKWKNKKRNEWIKIRNELIKNWKYKTRKQYKYSNTVKWTIINQKWWIKKWIE